MSDYAAPRTTEATTPAEVARVVARRQGPSAGWWGMAMLVASESMLFAMMFGSYFYLRFKAVHWPPQGIPEPKVVVPLILLAVLVSTSVPMQLASLAARAGRLAGARLFLVAATVVQAGYLAYELYDYRDQLQDFGIGRNAYSSIYYTLLGADHAHVALGLLFNLWLLGKLATGLTTYRMNATQAITWYWHAVNAITVVVFATLLSPHL